MAMDLGSKQSLKADINVTPLVDVMLVLLIIMKNTREFAILPRRARPDSAVGSVSSVSQQPPVNSRRVGGLRFGVVGIPHPTWRVPAGQTLGGNSGASRTVLVAFVEENQAACRGGAIYSW